VKSQVNIIIRRLPGTGCEADAFNDAIEWFKLLDIDL